jgi:hypothetical protein
VKEDVIVKADSTFINYKKGRIMPDGRVSIGEMVTLRQGR